MRRNLLCLVLALSSLSALAGCAERKPQALNVFAAISTKEAMEQIGRDFQSQTGTAVTCNFGGSSELARQIEQGAAADVFLSADRRWADVLAARGLAADRRDLLGNRLVVVTPADSRLKLERLADLPKADVKSLALTLDAVPAGHYAREALTRAGVWDEVKGRVREAGNVRAVLTWVAAGEADAGFVYATDAATTAKVRVALEVPAELHSPIHYAVVLVSRDGRHPEAGAFYQFLGGEAASAAFKKAGFQVLFDVPSGAPAIRGTERRP